MSQTTPEFLAKIVETCTQNAGALAAALGRSFGSTFAVEPGDSGTLTVEALPAALDGPGVVLAFQVGEQGVIGLLPATLPLPAWCSDCSPDALSRLKLLALECTGALLPTEIETEHSAAIYSDNLRSALLEAGPAAAATCLSLVVRPVGEASADDGAGSQEAAGLLFLVWPAATLPLRRESTAVEPVDVEADAAVLSHELERAAVAPAARGFANLPPDRLKLLRGLPVSIIVRLAEKKIEMGQLLALSPGTMITFNKSCEDLLDLYVNNHLYCRGEAVKIGEKFGLKVNQVGVVPVRDKSVLQG